MSERDATAYNGIQGGTGMAYKLLPLTMLNIVDRSNNRHEL